jgi:hypothetical protein
MVDPVHALASFWLDVIDKLVKLAAVCLGGIWTYWNYRKSRTYARKLDLQVMGNVQIIQNIYIDIIATLKNAGASRHFISSSDSYCTVSAILNDLSELPIYISNIEAPNGMLEPGESINAAIFHIHKYSPRMVWLKISLRTVSDDLEWYTSSILRVQYEAEQRERANRR